MVSLGRSIEEISMKYVVMMAASFLLLAPSAGHAQNTGSIQTGGRPPVGLLGGPCQGILPPHMATLRPLAVLCRKVFPCILFLGRAHTGTQLSATAASSLNRARTASYASSSDLSNRGLLTIPSSPRRQALAKISRSSYAESLGSLPRQPLARPCGRG
jgi:hypothetical protein